MDRSFRIATRQVQYHTCACLCLLLLLCPQLGATVPFSSHKERRADKESTTPSDSAAQLLRQQFINPAEILSVLLIIGGDIVQKACAQLSPGKKGIPITPVAFSFGWVAYAFGALMSAFGDGLMMPAPDITSAVAVVGGQRKTNESWVIGRFIRDMELYEKRPKDGETPRTGGLSVKFYRTKGRSCEPHRDKLWKSYLLFLPLQFGVAAAPMYHRNWSILLITCFGTALALLMASLPQWKREKFHGRMRTGGTYVLTRGNGHSHAFVIRTSEGDTFINLDDLAVSRAEPNARERAYLVILATSWIVLLITVGATKEDTWFLLAVGVIGMAHNVVVAGFKRRPEAHGIPVTTDQTMEKDTVDKRTVYAAIQEAEWICPGVGLSLISSFYPDGLRPDQEAWKKVSKIIFDQEKRPKRRIAAGSAKTKSLFSHRYLLEQQFE